MLKDKWNVKTRKWLGVSLFDTKTIKIHSIKYDSIFVYQYEYP